MGPYPIARRERAVRAVDNGASALEAARHFEVGEATVKRWVRRRREQGSLGPTVRRGRTPVLDEHADWLAQLRSVKPELSCQAVTDRLAEEKGLRVHDTTLWYWLQRNAITQNKILVASERERGDVALARWLWRRGRCEIEPERLVFLDETGTATNMAPRYRWGPRAERLVGTVPCGH